MAFWLFLLKLCAYLGVVVTIVWIAAFRSFHLNFVQAASEHELQQNRN